MTGRGQNSNQTRVLLKKYKKSVAVWAELQTP